MNKFFILFCCVAGLAGVVYADHDGILERIRARGRCREIRVRRTEVVVKFTCQEDAELFAEDLKYITRDR